MTLSQEPAQADRGRRRIARLTRWSLIMLPTALVILLANQFLYGAVLEARGQGEGDLFAMTEDFTGVALEVANTLVNLVAPVLGVALATMALRRRTTRTALVALVLNGILVLVVAYQFVDSIRMSFFAPLD